MKSVLALQPGDILFDMHYAFGKEHLSLSINEPPSGTPQDSRSMMRDCFNLLLRNFGSVKYR